MYTFKYRGLFWNWYSAHEHELTFLNSYNLYGIHLPSMCASLFQAASWIDLRHLLVRGWVEEEEVEAKIKDSYILYLKGKWFECSRKTISKQMCMVMKKAADHDRV